MIEAGTMNNAVYDVENFHFTEEQLSSLRELFGDRIDELSKIELLAVWLHYRQDDKPIVAAKLGKALGLSKTEGAELYFVASKKLRFKEEENCIIDLATEYEKLAHAQSDARKYKDAVKNYENALALWKIFKPKHICVDPKLCYANCLLRLGKAKNNLRDYTYKEYEEAKQICEEAAATSSSTTPRELLARAYFYLGQLMRYLSSSQETYYLKARDLCEQCIRKDSSVETHRLLVDVYMSLADFHLDCTPEYLSYCNRARETSEAIVNKNYDYYDSVVLGSIYETIAARIFDENEDAEHPVFDEAEINLVKAIAHYSNALSFKEYSDAKAGLMHCFSYLWEINTRRGSTSQSEEEFQRAYDALLADLKTKRDLYNDD